MSGRAYEIKSRGPRPGARKFDWDEAGRMHASGLSYSEIGRRLGVRAQSVRMACDAAARNRERFGPSNATVELIPAIERIGEHFVFSPDGCWHWTAAIADNGYGLFHLNGRHTRAHRAMYELLIGPIPTGMQLDHLCRVRHCINPGHLEPVTAAENMRRARVAARKPCGCPCTCTTTAPVSAAPSRDLEVL